MNMINMMGEVSGGANTGTWHCPLMTGFLGMGTGWGWLGGVFWLVTWVLVVLVLVALFRWLWKKGDK